MHKIYLACPYSHPLESVREQRVSMANKIAAGLMQQGYAVFSPISHSHGIAHHINNHLDHDFWLNQCLEFIPWCDELWIMQVKGWRESRGIKMEIEAAKENGKDVRSVRDNNELS